MAKYNLTEKKSKAPLYRSLLNADMIEDLFEKIMAKFVVEKKYRDPDYSAKEMADELGTNTRYISAVINMRYQDNYSQMVNEFRIKEAMYLLKNFHSRKMTMEDIALNVGFSNRQSFYSAFFTSLTVSSVVIFLDVYKKNIGKRRILYPLFPFFVTYCWFSCMAAFSCFFRIRLSFTFFRLSSNLPCNSISFCIL